MDIQQEQEKIQQARQASNAAIAGRDAAGVAAHYMEDIIVISGEGGKHAGKKNLLKIWKQIFSGTGSLFVRRPSEIIVSEDGQLAWESGHWNYLDGAPGGRYAAMWCRAGSVWKTRSELFVSL